MKLQVEWAREIIVLLICNKFVAYSYKDKRHILWKPCDSNKFVTIKCNKTISTMPEIAY